MNLFLEYEQNKKVKETPELLVGQTRYWNKSWYGKTLDFELRNAFLVEYYEPNLQLYRVKYLNDNFCGSEMLDHILDTSVELIQTLSELAPDT